MTNKCPECGIEIDDVNHEYESALCEIAYNFKSPEELRKESIGLSYEEHLEMAYENIIFVAMRALDGTF